MLIAQISDLHIAAPGSKTYGVAAMDGKLKSCIVHINAHTPKPDVVLVTGDLANCGNEAETGYARNLLDALDMPYFVIAGNHDSPAVMRQKFEGAQFPPAVSACSDYVIDEYPIRLIGMDSTRPKMPGGLLSQDQLSWLDETLSLERTKPTMIFMHHPPINCGVPETDEDGFEGNGELGRVVGRFDNIERILCGHIHLPVHVRWNGTIVSAAPSIGMHLDVDLAGNEPSQFVLGDPGYLLHHLHEDGHIVTHTKSLAPVSVPYPFEEQ